MGWQPLRVELWSDWSSLPYCRAGSEAFATFAVELSPRIMAHSAANRDLEKASFLKSSGAHPLQERDDKKEWYWTCLQFAMPDTHIPHLIQQITIQRTNFGGGVQGGRHSWGMNQVHLVCCIFLANVLLYNCVQKPWLEPPVLYHLPFKYLSPQVEHWVTQFSLH